MASGHEVEVTISSAKDLKNVNWRHGPNRPYAVVWVDPNRKCSTKVDNEGDTCPYWDETVVIPLPGPVDDRDTKLYIDIVHVGDEDDTKKLIGSAQLKLLDVLDESGFGEPIKRCLTLKRPSGRPHGKVDVKVTIREPRYRQRDAYHAPAYGVPPSHAAPPPPYGYQYGQPPPPNPYYSAAPTSGYPYGGYNAPPHATAQYGEGSAGYHEQHEEKKKSSKFGGMGTGLAVGAVAGVLGGIAIVEGVDALEDHIAEEAAEKVEEDLGYDDNDGGDDDF